MIARKDDRRPAPRAGAGPIEQVRARLERERAAAIERLQPTSDNGEDVAPVAGGMVVASVP